jgi:hypothetical protein
VNVVGDIPPSIWSALLAAFLAYRLGTLNGARTEKGKQITAQRQKALQVIHRYRAIFLQEARAATLSDDGSFDPKWVSPEWLREFAVAVFQESATLPKRDRERIYRSLQSLVGRMEAGIANDYAFLPEGNRSREDRANWLKAEGLRGTPPLRSRFIPAKLRDKINSRRGTARTFTEKGRIAELRAAHVSGAPDFRLSTEKHLKAALAEFDKILDYLT